MTKTHSAWYWEDADIYHESTCPLCEAEGTERITHMHVVGR